MICICKSIQFYSEYKAFFERFFLTTKLVNNRMYSMKRISIKTKYYKRTIHFIYHKSSYTVEIDIETELVFVRCNNDAVTSTYIPSTDLKEDIILSNLVARGIQLTNRKKRILPSQCYRVLVHVSKYICKYWNEMRCLWHEI